MNKFVKALLITLGINAFMLVLAYSGLAEFFIIIPIITAIEIVIGAIMAIAKQSRQTGAGVLVAGGIGLLIGLSICSSMSFGFH